MGKVEVCRLCAAMTVGEREELVGRDEAHVRELYASAEKTCVQRGVWSWEGGRLGGGFVHGAGRIACARFIRLRGCGEANRRRLVIVFFLVSILCVYEW